MKEYHKIISALQVAVPAEGVKEAVYFIGIGGIGMSALARYFVSLGVSVSGYDKTPTALTRQLATEGISIHFEDNPALVDQAAQLVVYTPGVPNHHKELIYCRENNLKIVKRSDVLGAITLSSFNICVAGTHGKTTTSTMVGHLLRHTGYGANAFLGGISVNYNSNFWSSSNEVCVVEADEYDRSFLKLSPDIAIISSMDADHLDIYGTAEHMEQAFIDFSARLKPGGILISKHGLAREASLHGENRLTYHAEDQQANAFAFNTRMQDGSYLFDVVVKEPGKDEWVLKKVVLNMGGKHNIENMIAAIIVAHSIGIGDEKIREAVAAFRGVKRRFEYIIKNSHRVLIDDYAHHPEELRALITGARALFPQKKCIVVFQPHLFSRTRDLADGFAEVLDLADEAILLPIYPAREQPMEGVNSEMIIDRMHNENRMVMDKEKLLLHFQQELEAHVEEGYEGWMVITAGAGDIDTLVAPLKELLTEKI